ncbi:MAG: copper resistance protein NlpE [Endomicrobia bacterium]|nr:copper resistance protein NlpE [Endomicrobiia bacterium]MCL2506167.1 copper resistance protein NlpE [Endomicrobiia bacterium]
MKKIALSAAAVCFLFGFMACGQKDSPAGTEQPQYNQAIETVHNSRDSLDWSGTYSGIISDINSKPVKVELTLNDNGSYELHINEDDDYTGNFTWNEAGSVITLIGDRIPRYYKVGEGFLIQLDSEKDEIMSYLSDNRKLVKI